MPVALICALIALPKGSTGSAAHLGLLREQFGDYDAKPGDVRGRIFGPGIGAFGFDYAPMVFPQGQWNKRFYIGSSIPNQMTVVRKRYLVYETKVGDRVKADWAIPLAEVTDVDTVVAMKHRFWGTMRALLLWDGLKVAGPISKAVRKVIDRKVGYAYYGAVGRPVPLKFVNYWIDINGSPMDLGEIANTDIERKSHLSAVGFPDIGIPYPITKSEMRVCHLK